MPCISWRTPLPIDKAVDRLYIYSQSITQSLCVEGPPAHNSGVRIPCLPGSDLLLTCSMYPGSILPWSTPVLDCRLLYLLGLHLGFREGTLQSSFKELFLENLWGPYCNWRLKSFDCQLDSVWLLSAPCWKASDGPSTLSWRIRSVFSIDCCTLHNQW